MLRSFPVLYWGSCSAPVQPDVEHSLLVFLSGVIWFQSLLTISSIHIHSCLRNSEGQSDPSPLMLRRHRWCDQTTHSVIQNTKRLFARKFDPANKFYLLSQSYCPSDKELRCQCDKAGYSKPSPLHRTFCHRQQIFLSSSVTTFCSSTSLFSKQ